MFVIFSVIIILDTTTFYFPLSSIYSLNYNCLVVITLENKHEKYDETYYPLNIMFKSNVTGY